jgi:hypothetical protein
MLFELINEDEKRIQLIRTSSLEDAGWKEKDLENTLARALHTSQLRAKLRPFL